LSAKKHSAWNANRSVAAHAKGLAQGALREAEPSGQAEGAGGRHEAERPAPAPGHGRDRYGQAGPERGAHVEREREDSRAEDRVPGEALLDDHGEQRAHHARRDAEGERESEHGGEPGHDRPEERCHGDRGETCRDRRANVGASEDPSRRKAEEAHAQDRDRREQPRPRVIDSEIRLDLGEERPDSRQLRPKRERRHDEAGEERAGACGRGACSRLVERRALRLDVRDHARAAPAIKGTGGGCEARVSLGRARACMTVV
jgi:hypothetical protein